MARKGWTQLSPGYRARLEKAGISKSNYEQGESIQAARGHAQTPERPTQTSAGFTRYNTERTRLSNTFNARKQAFFGTKPIWNPSRELKRLRDKPPPMTALRRWVKLTRDEWIDAIREDPTAASFLGYH